MHNNIAPEFTIINALAAVMIAFAFILELLQR